MYIENMQMVSHITRNYIISFMDNLLVTIL